jgi:uncharacterized cupredoxin-like copper-binding protein
MTPARRSRAASARIGVALVALLLVACGGGNQSGTAGSRYHEPAGAPTATIEISAGNFFFRPDHPTVSAGTVRVQLTEVAGIHDLVFSRVGGFLLEVDPSQTTDAKKIELKPGRYTFYCDIPGHRAAGMEGVLTVQ